jgi:hypothetical protein
MALLRFVGVTYSFVVDHIFFGLRFSPLQVCAVFVILGTNMAVTVFKIRTENNKLCKRSEVEFEDIAGLI